MQSHSQTKKLFTKRWMSKISWSKLWMLSTISKRKNILFILGCIGTFFILSLNFRLSVFVYDINGARLPYPTEVEQNVDVLCSLPMLKACEQVFVTHVTTDKVYLSRTSDAAYVTELCELLTKQYDAEELSKVPLEPGVFYAVKSKVFESWYRCVEISFEILWTSFGGG